MILDSDTAMGLGAAALLGGALLWWGIPAVREALRRQQEPVTTMPVRVVARRFAEETGAGWEPAERYFVTYLFTDGTTRELKVTQRAYESAAHGGCGTLQLRSDRFVGFVPQKQNGSEATASDPQTVA
jgi:hypothetical protein